MIRKIKLNKSKRQFVEASPRVDKKQPIEPIESKIKLSKSATEFLAFLRTFLTDPDNKKNNIAYPVTEVERSAGVELVKAGLCYWSLNYEHICLHRSAERE